MTKSRSISKLLAVGMFKKFYERVDGDRFTWDAAEFQEDPGRPPRPLSLAAVRC